MRLTTVCGFARYSVRCTTPRSAGLDVFTGSPASGEYRLYIADVAAGETATLTSWSITVTGQAIPEPSTTISVALMASLGVLRRRR